MIATGFFVVVLSIASLHLGDEWRAELWRFETGNLEMDLRNCERLKKSYERAAADAGRIVSCNPVEVVALPPAPEEPKKKPKKRRAAKKAEQS